ncbi:thiamine pyrophosphate-dependent enzyme [Robiginitomaculum antarcticum]|uniref:thiamine pyrophosphate-dependent enzyme n=1 Tax=Robiginitomaculum antarcticum TaxID=437507 RepID=UPI000360E2FA|nr:thiamine pyrophosphate-dependent enzyme [Robiginitomaculum antarcticum]
MAKAPHSTDTPKRGQSGSNRSRLHVPEPPFRPGDTPDYSHVSVPVKHTPVRPDPLCEPHETADHALKLIRVLRFNGEAVGDWNPNLSNDMLMKALTDMMMTRAMDERMFNMQRQGKMSFYMKSTGEEAVSVGHAMALKNTDMTFPTYRQQGILISRGASIKEMMCQCLSNSGDPLDGKSIPVLYSFKKHGFFSISGNLGTQLIQGVGWAMACAYKNEDGIASVFTGEGATAEGDFHYALNFASTYRAPCIINVVNNQWAISSYQGIAMGEGESFAARGTGYGLATLRVDGNDILAVYAATKWAAERARKGGGATLIEHFTYRQEGHSTSDDPSKYRPKDDSEAWPFGDPIARLKKHLISLGVWDDDKHDALAKSCKEEIRDIYKSAEAMGNLSGATHVNDYTMFEQVYEHPPEHLERQRRMFSEELD